MPTTMIAISDNNQSYTQLNGEAAYYIATEEGSVSTTTQELFGSGLGVTGGQI